MKATTANCYYYELVHTSIMQWNYHGKRFINKRRTNIKFLRFLVSFFNVCSSRIEDRPIYQLQLDSKIYPRSLLDMFQSCKASLLEDIKCRSQITFDFYIFPQFTVWKFKKSSANEILREINFCISKMYKSDFTKKVWQTEKR